MGQRTKYHTHSQFPSTYLIIEYPNLGSQKCANQFANKILRLSARKTENILREMVLENFDEKILSIGADLYVGSFAVQTGNNNHLYNEIGLVLCEFAEQCLINAKYETKRSEETNECYLCEHGQNISHVSAGDQ